MTNSANCSLEELSDQVFTVFCIFGGITPWQNLQVWVEVKLLYVQKSNVLKCQNSKFQDSSYSQSFKIFACLCARCTMWNGFSGQFFRILKL